MRNILAIILTMFLPSLAAAANYTYFIDSINGTDSNSGQTAGLSWKTLGKINVIAPLISFGDTVEIRLACGSRFEESLNLGPFKNKGASIKISAQCMDTARPLISGTKKFTSWTFANGYWDYPTTDIVKGLIVDGRYAEPARYPAKNQYVNVNQSTVASGSSCNPPTSPYGVSNYSQAVDLMGYEGACSFTVSSAIPGSLQGANAVIKTADYWPDYGQIITFSGNEFTLSSKTRFSSNTATFPAYFSGLKWMLNSSNSGEWAQDSSSVSLKADSYSPNSANVLAIIREVGIYAEHIPSLEISGIDVTNFYKYGIFSSEIGNLKIIDVNVRYGLIAGVFAQFTDSINVENNNISDSRASGIIANRSKKVVIKNNVVERIGLFGKDYGDLNQTLSAIYNRSTYNPPTGSSVNNSMTNALLDDPNACAFNDVCIVGNRVNGSAYIGIRTSNGSYVANNDVDNFCDLLSDCGGIYTDNQSAPYPTVAIPVTNIYKNHLVLSKERMSNVGIVGIYLDDFTSNAQVKNNSVSYASTGILVHLSAGNTLENNTVFASKAFGVRITDFLAINTAWAGYVKNNLINNNIIFTFGDRLGDVYSIGLQTAYGSVPPEFATLSGNKYGTVYGSTPLLVQTTTYSVPDLINSGIDATAIEIRPVEISPKADDTNLTTNPTMVQVLNGWTKYPFPSTLNFKQVGCFSDSECLTFGAADPTTLSALNSNQFSLTQGQIYQLRYSLSSFSSQVRAIVRRNGPNSYESQGYDKYWISSSTPINVTSYLKATSNLSNALISFETRGSFDVDNVYLAHAQGFDPFESAILISNRSTIDAYIDCPVQWANKCNELIGINGVQQTFPLLIPARSSKIAIWSKNPFISSDRTGLTAKYYNNINLSGSPALTRIDPQIYFSLDGSNASPAPGVINSDYFSVKWTGKIVPPVTGTYEFCTSTDDGVRLSINGTLLIDQWIPQAETQWCETIPLTQNQPVTIEMDFYDAEEEAVAKLFWSYPGQSQTIVPSSRLYAQ